MKRRRKVNKKKVILFILIIIILVIGSIFIVSKLFDKEVVPSDNIIDKDNNTSIKLSNQTNELIYTYSKNNKDYKVIPFSNPDIKTYLSDYERVYNKYASVIKNMDNTIEVNSIN